MNRGHGIEIFIILCILHTCMQPYIFHMTKGIAVAEQAAMVEFKRLTLCLIRGVVGLRDCTP
jgi:hypothetical protein